MRMYLNWQIRAFDLNPWQLLAGPESWDKIKQVVGASEEIAGQRVTQWTPRK